MTHAFDPGKRPAPYTGGSARKEHRTDEHLPQSAPGLPRHNSLSPRLCLRPGSFAVVRPPARSPAGLDGPVAPGHNGGAGFVPGIPRLRLPDINLADSAVGVRMAALQGRYATLLPSVIGLSASWDPDAAFLYGSVIGRELRAMGFNMSIGGGMDLIREPRNGRNFEYSSEDPILAGTMVGQLARGVQSNHIMGDIKHYALNDQETGRNTLNAELDTRALRETDLLAFQIAIPRAHPAG